MIPGLAAATTSTATGRLVSIDLLTLLPVLAPAAGAAAVLVADVARPGLRRVHYLLAGLAVLVAVLGTVPGLGAAAGDARATLCLPGAGLSGQLGACLYAASPVASALQLAALVGAGMTLLLSWPDDGAQPRGCTAVTVALVLSATTGAVAIAGARDLGTWLVALELATLPTVALVALRGSRSAVSGAVALLTTSLVSFALLVMAAACWYAATASPFLTGDAALVASADPGRRAVLTLAVVLAVAGLGFKLSLVPFHAWTPEAYAGAPLPVAAFLAGTSKVAALAGLLVVLSGITVLGAPALSAVAAVAAVSMTLGNVLALRQDDVVRLLAWSTVAQAGWVVLPLATVSAGAVTASGGYLLAYVVATLLAFAVVASLQRSGFGAGRALASYRGLVHTRPGLAAALGLALLSLAGLPPGVLGLVAKVVALGPVVADQLWLLAVVAALNAVLGVAVYLRWLRVVLDRETTVGATAAVTGDGAPASGSTGGLRTVGPMAPPRHVALDLAVAVGFAALVLTSVQPQLVLGLLGR